MYIDGNSGDYATQQSLTGTSDQNSTNVDNKGSAVKRFAGTTARTKIRVTVTACGGTNPTFRARYVGADSADLATNPIILADTGVSAVISSVPANGIVYDLVPSEQTTAKQYYGVIFTQGGTSPTATVNAQLVEAAQSNQLA